jgi:hypothetical protein
MLEFIVLGYIPGTTTQITFSLFVRFLAMVAGVTIAYSVIRSMRARIVRTVSLYSWYLHNWFRGTVA